MLKCVLRRMDDHFAAGPGNMSVPHLKILVQPRTGEMSEEPVIAVLRNFVFLVVAGGVRNKTANFHAWSTVGILQAQRDVPANRH